MTQQVKGLASQTWHRGQSQKLKVERKEELLKIILYMHRGTHILPKIKQKYEIENPLCVFSTTKVCKTAFRYNLC